MKIEKWQIDQLSSLPLEAKIIHSQNIIRNFYEHEMIDGNIYVSFSGGKDSTVLLDIVRDIYPNTIATFFNTGVEYPEVLRFIKETDNINIEPPKMNFKQVVDKYGYPIISKETANKIYDIRCGKSEKLRNKRLYGDDKGNGKLPQKWHFLLDAPFKISDKCCDQYKKNPADRYKRASKLNPIVGTTAEESLLRRTSVMKNGCNTFTLRQPSSKPLFFWKAEDIWAYIKMKNLPYSEIYNMGYDRTGCMYCMFAIMNEPDKFLRLKKSHPHQYNYCMNKLDYGKVLDYIGIPY